MRRADQRPSPDHRALGEENEVAGKTRYNFACSRIYCDADGQWNPTQIFGRNDLPVLGKVADRSHSRIFDQEAEEKSTQVG